MAGSTIGEATEAPPAISIRQIAAVVAGNALEFYDFLTFTFFTVQIAHTFFPDQDEDTKIFLTLAVFGVGFLTRPLGAIVIGLWGDRVGRKPAMMVSFLLMGVAIIGIALTPSRAQIGIAAPILFLFFRLLQGFALGGDVGPTTAYLLEVAPPLRRGLYASLQFTTQDISVLAAGIVGVVLSNLLHGPALDAWGWRIAFLIGAAIIPFGLIVRSGLPETLATAYKPLQPRARLSHQVWQLAVLGFLLLGAMTTTNYAIAYTTTFAENTLHIAVNVAFWATVASGLSGTCFDLVSGILSDRVGRKPVMLFATVGFLLVVFPAYYAIISWKSLAALLLGTAVLQCFQSLYAGPVLVTITEGLPRAIRSGGLAIIYAVPILIFGGSAQFVVKALIKSTGSAYAPAGFITGALAIALIAMIFVRETAPIKTGNM